MTAEKPKPRGMAVIVTDAAVLAFLRETGIADPDEIRKAMALAPGVIGAARMGKRSWTVNDITFHFSTPLREGAAPAITGVTSGPSADLGGREMTRLRYNDRGNNSLGNRRGGLSRKPKGDRRPATGPTEGEFDD